MASSWFEPHCHFNAYHTLWLGNARTRTHTHTHMRAHTHTADKLTALKTQSKPRACGSGLLALPQLPLSSLLSSSTSCIRFLHASMTVHLLGSWPGPPNSITFDVLLKSPHLSPPATGTLLSAPCTSAASLWTLHPAWSFCVCIPLYLPGEGYSSARPRPNPATCFHHPPPTRDAQ